MSRVTFDTVSPGDTVTAASLNTPFTNAATASATLNDQNFRTETFDSTTIHKATIIPANGSVKNTSLTAGTYVGTAFQAVAHGTNALTLPAITLLVGDTLVINWKQTILDITAAVPDITNRTIFKLYLDVGAGYVPFSSSPSWQFSNHTTVNGVLVDQGYRLNAAGSMVYTNTSVFTIPIVGIKLYIQPGNNVADSVDLTYGSISYLHFRR